MRFDPLSLIAGFAWWYDTSGEGSDVLNRLWRHAVAVGQAARRLAREAGDPDADRVARAGLLHGIGRWAVAAVDPEWLVSWLEEADPRGASGTRTPFTGHRIDHVRPRPRRALGLRPARDRRGLAARRPGNGADLLRVRPATARTHPGRLLHGRAHAVGDRTFGSARPRPERSPGSPARRRGAGALRLAVHRTRRDPARGAALAPQRPALTGTGRDETRA